MSDNYTETPAQARRERIIALLAPIYAGDSLIEIAKKVESFIVTPAQPNATQGEGT